MGQKVLTIDMDPQGNTTSGMGVEKNEVENTIYELLLGESKLEDCIIPLNFDNLSLIPSNVNLAGAEIELIGVEDKEFILKNAIDQVRDQYDFIIIDCPPSLNMLTINAMTTADTVLVPIQCEYYALEGLSQLMHTIELVQERLNPELEMEGVVFTMYDARTNLSLQVVENVKDSWIRISTKPLFREMSALRRHRATVCRSTITTSGPPVQRATVSWQTK